MKCFLDNLSHYSQLNPFFDMDKLKKFVPEKACPYGQDELINKII